MAVQLDDEALWRLLGAVILQWWRDCDAPDELAEFLGVPVDVVVSERPLRIDRWRRKVLERSV